MRKIKKLVKSIIGAYMIHVIKDKYNSFFRTSNYNEQLKFENKSLSFYSQFVKENDIVFDVGANFGNRIKTFLDLKAKVVAVEPQKDCCKYLRKYYGDRIILIDKALGANNEFKKMYISDNSAISSFSEDWINSVKQERYKEEEWKEGELIEQITLDSIIDKYGDPSFIKIDVEGYELEVIKGLTREINQISFEYTVPEQLEKAVECINHMKKFCKSIVCNYSLGESMEFQLENWISDSDMINLIQSKDFPTTIGDIYIKRK
jgi:FkbM family methyltransferase